MNCPFCNKTTIDQKSQPFDCKECINHGMIVLFYLAINCTILQTDKYSMSIYNNKTNLYTFNSGKMILFKFKVNVTPDTFDSTVSKLLKLKAYY